MKEHHAPMTDKRILFITAGPETWASSRLRAYWPAKYIEGSRVMTIDEINAIAEDPAELELLDEFDAIVYQKCSPGSDAARAMRATGRKVYWDVCDPLWWWAPGPALEIAQAVDAVVCSSLNLEGDLVDFLHEHQVTTRTLTIPDRLELSHYLKERIHQDVEPVRFIWFGIYVNRVALFGALANLDRLVANGHNIQLTILDERPDLRFMQQAIFPIRHERWSLEMENEIIASHDIALLPDYPGPWGKVKSNNRTLTALACGLPVTSGLKYNEMIELMDVELRAASAKQRRDFVDGYNVTRSARDWKELVNG
jgi:hypothetical protein